MFNEVITSLAECHGIRMLHLRHVAEDFVDGVHLSNKGIGTFAGQLAQFILRDRGMGMMTGDLLNATSAPVVRA